MMVIMIVIMIVNDSVCMNVCVCVCVCVCGGGGRELSGAINMETIGNSWVALFWTTVVMNWVPSSSFLQLCAHVIVQI